MSEESKDSTLVEYSGSWWANEISTAQKSLDERWREGARKVVNHYTDDRSEDELNRGNVKKYNIFWSNVQILKAALYATPPSPEVKRQHDDANDDVGRVASLILQRMLTFDLQEDNSHEHDCIQHAVEDRLVPGLGQVWLRYEPKIEKFRTEPVLDPMTGQELVPAQDAERIVEEEICMDYVHWDDFIWSPARTWDEVWWVGRRVWMKKKAFIKRFGKTKYDELQADIKEYAYHQGYPKGFEKGRVEVYEVWCEDTNKAYWIHCATKNLLDEKDDPYKLDDFFPCPPPLLATHSTSSLIPRPDYVMCQDQYDELDTLNDRIYSLTKALRVVGAYDSGFKELNTMLTGSELRMIPVDNWAAFAEKGGMKGVVDWFPVDVVAGVLDKLMIQRQAVVQQIFELTSISDIMRGVSQARETAKAQTLKAQYSSVRLQLQQQAVAKFVTSILRIKAEMISKLFQPESILQKSQIQYTESAQFAQPAIELIKNYEASEYRIYVGDQTLSLADYNAEREMRTEFLIAIGQFLSQAGQMAVAYPAALPYLLRMISWVAASFRGADDIESVLDSSAAAGQAGAGVRTAATGAPAGRGGTSQGAGRHRGEQGQDAGSGCAQRTAVPVQGSREDHGQHAEPTGSAGSAGGLRCPPTTTSARHAARRPWWCRASGNMCGSRTSRSATARWSA